MLSLLWTALMAAAVVRLKIVAAGAGPAIAESTMVADEAHAIEQHRSSLLCSVATRAATTACVGLGAKSSLKM